MPQKLSWTDAQDTTIRRLRAEGETWDTIAGLLKLSRYTVVQRGREIGARPPPPGFCPPRDDPNREPLRAGDPRTWAPLVSGTFLDGVPYEHAIAALWPVYPQVRSNEWNSL